MRLLDKHAPKGGPKVLKSSASALGLVAGAIGWSGLAKAASEETLPETLSLPDHYHLGDDGVAVFKFETGEELSLTPDQYLILQDGLVLITDELAQASIYSMPVMGSVEAQLLSDLDPIATAESTVAMASPAQTLSVSMDQSPRLSEQVEFQSYQVAQSSNTNNDVDDVLLPLGFWGTGSMLLMAMLNSDGQSDDDEAASEDAAPVIVEADWMAIFGRTTAGNSPSAEFDTSDPFVNANGDVMTGSEPLVWPYARATDADGDTLVWGLAGARSSDYAGYDEDYDSPSEFLNEFDIFWNEEGSAYIIWSDELETWYGSSSGVLASDTWTWDIVVSDGSGLTDSASISLDFPPPP